MTGPDTGRVHGTTRPPCRRGRRSSLSGDCTDRMQRPRCRRRDTFAWRRDVVFPTTTTASCCFCAGEEDTPARATTPYRRDWAASVTSPAIDATPSSRRPAVSAPVPERPCDPRSRMMVTLCCVDDASPRVPVAPCDALVSLRGDVVTSPRRRRGDDQDRHHHLHYAVVVVVANPTIALHRE